MNENVQYFLIRFNAIYLVGAFFMVLGFLKILGEVAFMIGFCMIFVTFLMLVCLMFLIEHLILVGR